MSQRKIIPIWEIKRTPDFELISIKDLEHAEHRGDIDEWYMKEFQSYLQGKRTATLTRIKTDKIIPGFMERIGGNWVYKKDDIDLCILTSIIESIRHGERSTLDIYPCWSDKNLFCCPDDQYTLEAYRALGIKMVPVRIFRQNKDQNNESGIITKCFSPKGHKPVQVIESFQPKAWDLVETYSAPEICYSFGEEIDKIGAHVLSAIENLKNFHIPKNKGIHYHHCMYSILLRMKGIVFSIKHLIGNSQIDEANILVRSLYELALNFYLDWLSPHYMGPYIKAYSLTKRTDWSSPSSKIIKSLGEKEFQSHRIREYDLITSIKEKAGIFPLGKAYYEESYKNLSAFAHQSFTLMSDSADLLETIDRDAGEEKEENIKFLILNVSTISAIVIRRIESDIGKDPNNAQ